MYIHICIRTYLNDLYIFVPSLSLSIGGLAAGLPMILKAEVVLLGFASYRSFSRQVLVVGVDLILVLQRKAYNLRPQPTEGVWRKWGPQNHPMLERTYPDAFLGQLRLLSAFTLLGAAQISAANNSRGRARWSEAEKQTTEPSR